MCMEKIRDKVMQFLLMEATMNSTFSGLSWSAKKVDFGETGQCPRVPETGLLIAAASSTSILPPVRDASIDTLMPEYPGLLQALEPIQTAVPSEISSSINTGRKSASASASKLLQREKERTREWCPHQLISTLIHI
jgi:hypothetical protein